MSFSHNIHADSLSFGYLIYSVYCVYVIWIIIPLTSISRWALTANLYTDLSYWKLLNDIILIQNGACPISEMFQLFFVADGPFLNLRVFEYFKMLILLITTKSIISINTRPILFWGFSIQSQISVSFIYCCLIPITKRRLSS